MIQEGGGARSSTKVWGPWGVIPPVEVPGYPDELVAALVMVATSESGTPAAWRRVVFSVTAGRLVQMATRIWTFSSCACMSFSFWRRRSFMFWKWRIQEKGYISYRIRLLGVVKLMLYVEKGEVTHNWNGIFCSLGEHWTWFIPSLYSIFTWSYRWPPSSSTSPQSSFQGLKPAEVLGTQGGHQPPTPPDKQLAPRLAVASVWHQIPTSVLPVTERDGWMDWKGTLVGWPEGLSIRMAYPQYGFP